MQPCDREGVFRGLIREYGIKEFPTGSVAIKFRAELTEIYDFDGEVWNPWADYDMEVFGDCFVVKKDGTLNEAAIRSLVDNAGWDGRFQSVTDATWKPTPCQFSVKRSEHNGNVYYNAAFVNGFDDVPGGSLPKMDEAKVKGLDARFGSQLRALTGNKMRNQAPPPAGAKPPAPPKGKQEPVAAGRPPSDDIPFALIGFLLSLVSIGSSLL